MKNSFCFLIFIKIIVCHTTLSKNRCLANTHGIAIKVEMEEEMIKMVKQLDGNAMEVGLNINQGKTEVMKLLRNEDNEGIMQIGEMNLQRRQI